MDNKRDFSEKAKYIFEDAKYFIKDATRQAVGNVNEDYAYRARCEQFRIDVDTAVIAFIELKADDLKIMELLKEFYGIDSIAEAQEIILFGHKNYCFHSFKAFLEKNHCVTDIGLYRQELSYELEDHPETAKLSNEKILKILEKRIHNN